MTIATTERAPGAPWEGRAVGTAAPDGFRRLYDAESGRLAGYCYQLTRNRELAEDLAQEAFVRLFSRWLTVRDPKPYLFHVATNLVRSTWRQQVRENTAWRSSVVDDVAPPHDLAVRDAVSRLPDRYREVVLLHYYADLTVPLVAKAVRRPEGSVKRMLSEARALLATSLGGPDA